MQLAGKIIKDGAVVGRIQMGVDGVAVVYVGATGTEALKDEGGAVRHVEILTGGAAATVKVDAPIVLTEQELQSKASALGIMCEHIDAIGGDVQWATLSKNGVSANLNKNHNGAWSLTKNPDGDILTDITNSTVDGNLAVMAKVGEVSIDAELLNLLQSNGFSKSSEDQPMEGKIDTYLLVKGGVTLQMDFIAGGVNGLPAYHYRGYLSVDGALESLPRGGAMGANEATEWVANNIKKYVTQAQADDSQKATDTAYLQSVIDGKEDMLDPEFADKLEGAYIRHAGDAEIESLFNDALAAYEKNMLAEASKLS
jgi:hypothetical protein